MRTNSALVVPPPSPAAPAAAQAPTFHDGMKPLIAIPNYLLWTITIAAVLIFAIAAWYMWKNWRKKAATIRMAPPVPPHIHARRVLHSALSLISQPKPFSIAVSGAVRVYLEARFQFHAPDRTTEEFLHELGQSDLLTVEQKQSLAQFLESCDLIKFAKYEPTETELRALHAAALRLVNETEPRVTQPATSAAK